MSTTTSTPVNLEGDLTIQSAAAQREHLLSAIEKAERDLTLNLSAIESVDSAGVQLLLAARRTLADQGRALWLSELPAALDEALSTLGVKAMFQPARQP